MLCTFWLGNLLSATTAHNFSSLIWPHGSVSAALASLLFDPPEPQIIGKTPCSYLFARLHLLSSHSFSSLIFSLLLFSSLTLSTSASPSVHTVGSLTSKLPSTSRLVGRYLKEKEKQHNQPLIDKRQEHQKKRERWRWAKSKDTAESTCKCTRILFPMPIIVSRKSSKGNRRPVRFCLLGHWTLVVWKRSARHCRTAQICTACNCCMKHSLAQLPWPTAAENVKMLLATKCHEFRYLLVSVWKTSQDLSASLLAENTLPTCKPEWKDRARDEEWLIYRI